MKEKIIQLAAEMQGELVTMRRDFHRHAEAGWTEFRTASIVAKHLEDYGYKVLVGEDVIAESAMMGVPSDEILKLHMERAKMQGALTQYLDKMKGGKTGVVGILETGKPGPVIGLRFDIDANDMSEAKEEKHRPLKEGFASINDEAMHACGHDGHTAVGLGVAKVLMELKDKFSGTIKLIFQPAEEGVRGAASMAEKGIVNDVDYLLGMHLGTSGAETGTFICGTNGFLATSKFDAMYKGVPAHAGAKPEEGKSALLAAASATMSLQGIYRHSKGASRINIGVLQAGTGRNVVPDKAVIKIETRGITSEIDDFVKKEALRMIKASALMYDVEVEIKEVGGAKSGQSDDELIVFARKTAEGSGLFNKIIDTADLGGSEDFTYLMDRVQKKGGKSSYVIVGTKIAAGHHNSYFDFDEEAMHQAVAILLLMVQGLANP
ncbi:MAG: amidohydrolase [Spirochaetes bacterium]|nr:amidohydrolase [Spirochaetota bacterium]